MNTSPSLPLPFSFSFIRWSPMQHFNCEDSLLSFFNGTRTAPYLYGTYLAKDDIPMLVLERSPHMDLTLSQFLKFSEFSLEKGSHIFSSSPFSSFYANAFVV